VLDVFGAGVEVFCRQLRGPVGRRRRECGECVNSPVTANCVLIRNRPEGSVEEIALGNRIEHEQVGCVDHPYQIHVLYPSEHRIAVQQNQFRGTGRVDDLRGIHSKFFRRLLFLAHEPSAAATAQ